MTKASKLSWGPIGGNTTKLYAAIIDMWSANYPVGAVSRINVVCYHAFVRQHLYEPLQFMASFPTREEAMDFVTLMVANTDYGRNLQA
jgi:hypothetical protein